MEGSRDIYLNIPTQSVHYKLSLDDLDMTLLPMIWLMGKCEPKDVCRPSSLPLSDQSDSTSVVEFELAIERDGKAEEQNSTCLFHICNIDVPHKYSIEHDKSRLHLQLSEEAFGRLSRNSEHQQNKTRGKLFCAPCNKEILSVDAYKKEPNPKALKRREDLLATLLDIYNEDYEAYYQLTYCDGYDSKSLKMAIERDKEDMDLESNIDNTATETIKSPRKLLMPDVINIAKGIAKKQVTTQMEDTKLSQDIIEIRTKSGDLLTVPKYYFHGILVSSSINNDLHCIFCNNLEMSKIEVEKHLKTTKHMDFIRKLALDKYGIRKVNNLIYSGKALCHCVICNLIVCDATLHVASSGHQKRQQIASKKSVQIDANRVGVSHPVVHLPKDRPESLENLTQALNMSSPSTVAPQRLQMYQQGSTIHQSPYVASHIHDNVPLGGSRKPDTRAEGSHASDGPTISQGATNHLATDSVISLKTVTPQRCASRLQSPTEAGPAPQKKYPSLEGAFTFQSSAKENEKISDGTVGTQAVEEFIEVQTVGGKFLSVPQYNFHGIRTIPNTSSCSESITLRCMLCMQRGIAHSEIQQHIKSSMHTYCLQKYALLDDHGMRNMKSDSGPSLGHCIVCNHMISDATLHIASPIHQVLQHDIMKKNAKNLIGVLDIDNVSQALQKTRFIGDDSRLKSSEKDENSAIQNQNEIVRPEGCDSKRTISHQISRTKTDSKNTHRCLDGDYNNHCTRNPRDKSTDKSESNYTPPKTAVGKFLNMRSHHLASSPNGDDTKKIPCLKHTPGSFSLPAVLVTTDNGELLAIPSYNFHGIRNSSKLSKDQKVLNAQTTSTVLRCMLCQKSGMKETELELHLKSSKHVGCIEKLEMDQNGIRKNANVAEGRSVSHCVFCNVLTCDSVEHISSPEHKKRQYTARRSLVNVRKNSKSEAKPVHNKPLQVIHQVTTEHSGQSNRHFTSRQVAHSHPSATESKICFGKHHTDSLPANSIIQSETDNHASRMNQTTMEETQLPINIEVSDIAKNCNANKYYCNICAKKVPNHENIITEHNNGAKHKRALLNGKNKIAKTSNGGLQKLNVTGTAQHANKFKQYLDDNAMDLSGKHISCTLCSKTLHINDSFSLGKHVKSLKHKKKLEIRKLSADITRQS